MLVLWWNSMIPISGGRLLAFPIAVPDADLDAFAERLTREGGLCVDRLVLESRADGYAYIVDAERTFVAVSGTAQIRNYDRPVRQEVDEEDGPASYSDVVAEATA